MASKGVACLSRYLLGELLPSRVSAPAFTRFSARAYEFIDGCFTGMLSDAKRMRKLLAAGYPNMYKQR
jgi:hypothetical protein